MQNLVFWLATEAGPVRVIAKEQESVFFTLRSDLAFVQKLLDDQLSFRHASIELTSFTTNEPVEAIYFQNQRDLGFARALLQRNSITCYEADVRPTDRFLMERFVVGAAEVTGNESRYESYIELDQAQFRPTDVKTPLDVVSLDIETSVSRNIVISIAIYGKDTEKVFMLSDQPSQILDYVESVADERRLLEVFLDWFANRDPDCVIGWSVVNFDLRFLQERCDFYKIPFTLGRADSEVRWRTVEQGQQRVFAMVPGRTVLDGIELLRTATYSFESFSLENVARELLGRGSLLHLSTQVQHTARRPR
ncbi:MAG: 3'-5' exonuclease, partial [Pseudomonadota bacterium]